jgi:hypothetical protein
MRVLVRDDTTRLYWGAGDRWVANSADAWDFETVEAAGLKAREFKADNASVVLSYEEPPCELALSLANFNY